MMGFEQLCSNTAVQVLHLLDIASIHSVSLTSKKLYEFSNLNDLWQLFYFQSFNAHPDYNTSCNHWSYDDDPLFWKKVYVAAYTNTHDLWIRHWTCAVYPQDGVLPGRCCIPNMMGLRKKSVPMEDLLSNGRTKRFSIDLLRKEEAALLQVCPTCRYHPCLPYIRHVQQVAMNSTSTNNSSTSKEILCKCQLKLSKEERIIEDLTMHTKAYVFAGLNGLVSTADESKALFLSSILSASKAYHRVKHEWGILDDNDDIDFGFNDPLDAEIVAEDAFASAATLQRRIDTTQFESTGLKFLTDTLFFSCAPVLKKNSGFEEYDVKQDIYSGIYGDYCDHQELDSSNSLPTAGLTPLSSMGALHDSAMLTCHIVRLTNPDYFNSISFQVKVQRPDCFGAQPCKGFLRPGETLNIRLYVRLSEFLTSYQDKAGSCVNEKVLQGAITKVPFLFQYILCPPIPCLPIGFDSFLQDKNIVEYLWSTAMSIQIRSIHVAAHINHNYSYIDFEHRTLMPHNFQSGNRNNIKPHSTKWFSELNNKRTSSNRNATYALNCVLCNQSWNFYNEILGRNFFLEKLSCTLFSAMLDKEKNLLREELKFLYSTISERENWINDIEILRNIQYYSRMMSRTMSNHENISCKVTKIRQIKYGSSSKNDANGHGSFWLRFMSAFNSMEVFDIRTILKERNNIISAFTNFWHFPQEDLEDLHQNIFSDLFLGKTTTTFASAVAFLQYPRQLVANGVYFSVAFPNKVMNTSYRNHLGDLFNGMQKSCSHSASCKYCNEISYIKAWAHDFEVEFRVVSKYETVKSCLFKPPPLNDLDYAGFLMILLNTDSQRRVRSHQTHLYECYDDSIITKPQTTFEENDQIQRTVAIERDLHPGLHILSFLFSSFGWETIEESIPLVDRRILIASQWMANSFWMLSMMVSLGVRWMGIIPIKPIESIIEESTFRKNQLIGILSRKACGSLSLFIFVGWLTIGRYCERYLGRSYERYILDCYVARMYKGGINSFLSYVKIQWYYLSPSFLQQVLTPKWTLLSKSKIKIYTVTERSKRLSRRNTSYAHDLYVRKPSTFTRFVKSLFLFAILLVSYFACTSYFALNLTTIFFSSVALGLSCSIEELELGRKISFSRVNDHFESRNIFVLSIFFSLIGQIIGGSGGPLFIIEVIATAVVLFITGGGLTAISSSQTADCWSRFVCFLIFSVWGYSVARIGCIVGIQKHYLTRPSKCLLASIVTMTLFLLYLICIKEWPSPKDFVKASTSHNLLQ